MTITWLHLPHLDLHYIATRLYGSKSRLYTQRLRKKMTSQVPFEAWEIRQLEQIKQELLFQLKQGSPMLNAS